MQCYTVAITLMTMMSYFSVHILSGSYQFSVHISGSAAAGRLTSDALEASLPVKKKPLVLSLSHGKQRRGWNRWAECYSHTFIEVSKSLVIVLDNLISDPHIKIKTSGGYEVCGASGAELVFRLALFLLASASSGWVSVAVVVIAIRQLAN